MTATGQPTRSAVGRLGDDRHRLGTSVFLHLAPGIAFVVAAAVLARLAAGRGLPAFFGLIAAAVLVLIPVELGLIALAARQRTGSWSLRGALRYTNRLPTGRLVVLGAATLAWAAFVFTLGAPVGEALESALFPWWPVELDHAGHLVDPERYSRALLITAWGGGLAITTIAAPVVEELYFRGFLLPRIAHLGRWAPVVNTVLFAVYHLWSPWQAPTRIAAMLPLYYLTWRTRAIALAIAVHVALNLIGDTIASAPVVFS